MTLREDLLKKYFAKSDIGGTISINDLRDREFNGESLSAEEKQALQNFDRFRIEELNAQTNDMDFHERYRQLQVMANLADWKDFLHFTK
ncbi:MAG TPA: hypothetical protein VL651_07435 [Bacteroidia bacterium]|jgi:hypothetical protein|nr:hypothetical protein [Bacteroidia bacterium]